MEQFSLFLDNHTLLASAFIIVTAFIIWDYIDNTKHHINSTQAIKLINEQDAIILDIRAMADFNQGHIINAVNIPLNSLKKQLNQIQKYKDSPVIVSCKTGAQASMACKTLKENDFNQVYNLSGGMLSWQNANMPISQS